MNAQEAVLLCRYTKALCPQQAIDPYTPDAWLDVLEHVRLDDAKAAVVAVASVQPFVSPSEILKEVKRIRAKRIAEAGDLVPPPDLSVLETQRWLRDARSRIGDGETVDQDAAYPGRELRHLPDLRALMPSPSVAERPEAPQAAEAG